MNDYVVDEYMCCLCGIPFQVPPRTKAGSDDPDTDAPAAEDVEEDLDDHFDGELVSKDDLQWIGRVRVIARYSKDGKSESEKPYPEGMEVRDGYWISGIGLKPLVYEAEVTVPFCYNDVLPDDSSEWDDGKVEESLVIYRGDSPDEPARWSYPAHDACLQILEAAFIFKQDQLGASTKLSWKLLHYVFYEYMPAFEEIGSLQVDYHLGGEFGDRWMVVRGEEECVSDPINVPSIRVLLANPPPLEDISPSSGHPMRLSRGPNSTDVFARLPPELVLWLVSYLPDSAVVALRLVSRAVAVLPLEASQAFWMSRIALRPLIIPADLEFMKSRHGNWREVYLKLKTARKNNGELAKALGFRNRARIWNVCTFLVRDVAILAQRGERGWREDRSGNEE